MNFTVEIDIMPLKGILDPQGRTIQEALKKLGIEEAREVRMGKHIHMVVSAADEKAAREQVERALEKLLYNPVVEEYSYTIKALSS